MHLITIATCTLKAGVELLPPSWQLAFPVFMWGLLNKILKNFLLLNT